MNPGLFAVIGEGLKLLGELADRGAIDGVKDVVRSLLEMHEGKTTPQVVLAELESMRAGLAGNDTATDTALHDRFDHESKK